jgi:hypothetical protein
MPNLTRGLPRQAGDGAMMRSQEAIDSELRLLTAVRRVAAEHGAVPSIGPIDELLDERRDTCRGNTGR